MLDEDGLKIIEDVRCGHMDLLLKALEATDPDGKWRIEPERGRLIRGNGLGFNSQGAHKLKQHLAKARSEHTGCYIWGKGFIAARKVRFLHASMRVMLLAPPRSGAPGTPNAPDSTSQRPGPAWDVAEYGVPVNQPDMAFALLTFGYLILRGLDQWGCRFDLADKNAMIHMWGLIGRIMGVEGRFIPRTWQRAERLFNLMLRQQVATPAQAAKGALKVGKQLTHVLFEVLEDLLPHCFGLQKKLPAVAVRDLLGRSPEHGELALLLLNEDHRRSSEEFVPRLAYFTAKVALHIYFPTRQFFRRHFAPLWAPIEGGLHNLTEELIESMQGAYRREPFFIPESPDSQAWVPMYGGSLQLKKQLASFNTRLVHWRQKIYKWLFIALAPIFLGILSLAIGIAVFVLWIVRIAPSASPGLGAGFFGLAAIGLLAGSWILHHQIPSLFKDRPKIADCLPILPQAPES